MRKTLCLLSSLFVTLLCSAQAADPDHELNPDANRYAYSSLADAVDAAMKVNQRISVSIGGMPTQAVIKRISKRYTPNGVTIIDKLDGTAIVLDMSQAVAINARLLGFVGDSATDETNALRKLRDLAKTTKYKRFVFPGGQYRVTDTVPLPVGVEIYSEAGDTATFIGDFPSAGHGTCGVFEFESKDSNSYITGINLHNIKITTNASILGADQWMHCIALLGTKNAILRDLTISDFRGDAIYVGVGKSANPADKRFNINPTIEHCDIDGGPLFANRNGISITNCDGFRILNNHLKHIGNTQLSFSVGGIDVERNYDYDITRNAVIAGNTIEGLTAVNTSAITMFTTIPVGLKDLAAFFDIHDNYLINCYWDIKVNNYVNSRPSNGERAIVNIHDNYHLYSKLAIGVAGAGISIHHETFKGDIANTNYSNIQVGHIAGWTDIGAMDVEISNCNFFGCGQSGVIEADNVQGLNIHDNTSVDGRPFVYLYIDAQSSLYRKMNRFRVVNNQVYAPGQNDITAGNTYLINAPAGVNLNNVLINGNSVVEGNTLGNRVALYAGSEFYFNHSIVTHTPTAGSWDAGNELYLTPTSTGGTKIICTVGGTFPIAGDTAINTFSATNGSNYITYTRGKNVLASKLREGQYVSLTGSALRYKIIGTKDTSGLYVDQAYNGSTGSTTASWIAPTFRYQTTLSKYTNANGNIIIIPGNQNEFIEGNLTGSRRYTLGWDATTLEGVEKIIRNNSTVDMWLIMGNDGVGDTVTVGGKTDSIPIYAGGELRLRSTSANTWRIQNYYVPTLVRGTDTSLSWNGKMNVNGPVSMIDGTGAGTIIKNRITSTSITTSVPNIMGFTDNTSGTFPSGSFFLGARSGFIFWGNLGTSPRALFNISNLGRFGLDGITPFGNAKFDFTNQDSLPIRLPGLTRTAMLSLSSSTGGLIAYDNQYDKIVYYTRSGLRAILDSNAIAGNYMNLADTGRGNFNKITGAALNKVKDSILSVTPGLARAAITLNLTTTGSGAATGSYNNGTGQISINIPTPANSSSSALNQTYTGTVTADGTVASSPSSLKYSWFTSPDGKFTTLKMRLKWNTPSSSVTEVQIPLPTDCPTPFVPADVTANTEIIAGGSVLTQPSNNASITLPNSTSCSLVKMSTSPSGFNIQLDGNSFVYAILNITIIYQNQ